MLYYQGRIVGYLLDALRALPIWRRISIFHDDSHPSSGTVLLPNQHSVGTFIDIVKPYGALRGIDRLRLFVDRGFSNLNLQHP